MTDAPLPPLPPATDESHAGVPVRETIRAKRKALRRRRLARQEACFEAMSAGYTPQQIAARLKVSVNTVRRDIDRAVDARRLQAPDRYIHLQVDRLTRALRSVDDRIERGDMKAILPLVRLTGALDRYHGLDARWRRNPLPPLPVQPAEPVALPRLCEIPLQIAEKDPEALETAWP